MAYVDLYIYVQGEQLNIAVFFWYLGTVTYTGQVTLYKVPEEHGHV